jgi:hypothetical protein
MSERSEGQRNQSRKWYVSRAMEEAIEEAEPAAEWLRTHPPGSRLPDELEPGYEPGEYEPESDGADG